MATYTETQKAAAALGRIGGRIGGRSTSAAKRAASAANGKAGGRAPKNVFRASEVESGGAGWIVDLSPENVVNPDCYWHFETRADALKFGKLVQAGIDPHAARANLDNYRVGEYRATARSDSGASVTIGYYSSISAAVRAARSQYGPGWRIVIEDALRGATVKEFTTRK